jgi:hypothetical protein
MVSPANSTLKAEEAHDEKQVRTSEEEHTSGNGSSLDLLTYHERNAGSLVVDPECVCFLLPTNPISLL